MMNDLFAALAGFGRGRLERQDRRIAEEQRQFQNDLQQEAMALQKRQVEETIRQFDAQMAQANKQFQAQIEQANLSRWEDARQFYWNYQLAQRGQALQEQDAWNRWASTARSQDREDWLAQGRLMAMNAQTSLAWEQSIAQSLENHIARLTGPARAEAIQFQAEVMKRKEEREAQLFKPMLAEAEARLNLTETQARQAEAVADVLIEHLPANAALDMALKAAQLEDVQTNTEYRKELTKWLGPQAQAQIQGIIADVQQTKAQTGLIQTQEDVLQKKLDKAGLGYFMGRDPAEVQKDIDDWNDKLLGIYEKARKVLRPSSDVLQSIEQAPFSIEEWAKSDDAYLRGLLVQAQGLEQRIEAANLFLHPERAQQAEQPTSGDMEARRQQLLADEPKRNAPAQGRPSIWQGLVPRMRVDHSEPPITSTFVPGYGEVWVPEWQDRKERRQP